MGNTSQYNCKAHLLNISQYCRSSLVHNRFDRHHTIATSFYVDHIGAGFQVAQYCDVVSTKEGSIENSLKTVAALSVIHLHKELLCFF